jgi:hypothetical protein
VFHEHLRKKTTSQKRTKKKNSFKTRTVPGYVTPCSNLSHLKTKRRNSEPMASNVERTKAEEDEYVATNCASMLDQGGDNEEETQMTCDVLCALGSSSPQIPCSMRSDSPTSMEWPAEAQRKGSKQCPKQLQLPMFLSSKFEKADHHSCQVPANSWSLTCMKGFRFALCWNPELLLCRAIYTRLLGIGV